MKTAITVASLAFALIAGSISPSAAQQRPANCNMTGTCGPCPPNTCSPSGTPYASNTAYCHAKNCKSPVSNQQRRH